MVPVFVESYCFHISQSLDNTTTFKQNTILEALPIPEKNASGTLSTNAHGQEITRNVKAV